MSTKATSMSELPNEQAAELQERAAELKERAAIWREIAGLIADVRGLVSFGRTKFEEVIEVAAEKAKSEITRRGL